MASEIKREGKGKSFICGDSRYINKNVVLHGFPEEEKRLGVIRTQIYMSF